MTNKYQDLKDFLRLEDSARLARWQGAPGEWWTRVYEQLSELSMHPLSKQDPWMLLPSIGFASDLYGSRDMYDQSRGAAVLRQMIDHKPADFNAADPEHHFSPFARRVAEFGNAKVVKRAIELALSGKLVEWTRGDGGKEVNITGAGLYPGLEVIDAFSRRGVDEPFRQGPVHAQILSMAAHDDICERIVGEWAYNDKMRAKVSPQASRPPSGNVVTFDPNKKSTLD